MSDCTAKILIIDDEVNICHVLGTRLTLLGYKTVFASDGKEALTKFSEEKPDLIILDIMLPRIDGYEVCRKIRCLSQVPIIMLTALGSISERITGLEMGADDYVIKPFSPKELEARIKAILRRAGLQQQALKTTKQTFYKFGELAIDIKKRHVVKNQVKIKLTTIECSLLELFVDNAGKRLSRTMILDNVWGYTPERYVDSRIVDVHISRLRSKLEEDPSNPDLIQTARGVGYMFQKY